MDDFVRNKLTEWGLSELIDTFKDHSMDKESLYDLDDQDIKDLIPEVGPRAKFKKRLKQLKEEQNSNQAAADSPVPSQQEHEEAADSVQALPSTSTQGKRKLDLQGESSKWKSPNKRQRENNRQSYTEAIILSDVKNIMGSVFARLHHQDNTKLNDFLRTKIHDLETDKRELVGVFGKTGAGKSSLINAIIGEKDLLPTERVKACTSVMIKVEANINSKYEADIEFITPEEWKDEMWPLTQFHGNRDQEREDDNKDNEEYRDLVEKLSVLYGDEWKGKTPEELIEKKKFREIPEFLQSNKKTLTCESAQELSAKLAKYTRNPSSGGENKEVSRYCWPLVKCVTVKVPNNDLLQHVTLVDLPGNGDRNKSRDKMWKGIVGDCSTVWIVADNNRAAGEDNAWEILENACSLMGNGGQCQRIHFICTKSDQSADDRANILDENVKTKEEVRKEFHKLNTVEKHFQDNCLEVFTVSSKEFLKRKCLNPEDTEIPKLKEFLRDLNNCHSETLNYVKGAIGILSLMCGAKSAEATAKKAEVCRDLEENMRRELNKVRKSMKGDYHMFEERLKEGVETSKNSWDKTLKSILHPRGVSGRAFHKTLKSLVKNGGVYKPKKGKQININMKLASYLTNSIDEEFRKTFPNEVKCGPFNGVIDKFSLGTDELLQNYKDVGLQLNFLKTEEEKVQAKLHRIIRKRKKKIYNCLTEKIEEIMQECYKKAAEFRGEGSLEKMRTTITTHVYENIIMFEKAKFAMLNQLTELKMDVLEILQETMKESIEISLKTKDNSIPDVPTELEMVKRYYDQLNDNPDGETSLLG